MNQLFVLTWYLALARLGWPAAGPSTVIPLVLVMLPALILFSTLTYYLIERPFMRLKDSGAAA